MTWKISKSFEFNYGHRIATQQLDDTFSLEEQCKCRFLHGHTATIEVTLQSNKLKEGFVTDFYHLNWLKKWINDNIDHKFIIDKDDPLIDTLCPDEHIRFWIKPTDDEMGSVFGGNSAGKNLMNRTHLWPPVSHITEYYESFYFVDFPPTSECLSKWIYDFVEEKMKPLEVEVTSVTWYESPRSKAVYNGGSPSTRKKNNEDSKKKRTVRDYVGEWLSTTDDEYLDKIFNEYNPTCEKCGKGKEGHKVIAVMGRKSHDCISKPIR